MAAFSDCDVNVVATGNTTQVLALRPCNVTRRRRVSAALGLRTFHFVFGVLCRRRIRLVMVDSAGIEVVDVARAVQRWLRRKIGIRSPPPVFSPDEHALVIGTRSGAFQWLDSKNANSRCSRSTVSIAWVVLVQITALPIRQFQPVCPRSKFRDICILWEYRTKHVQLGSF